MKRCPCCGAGFTDEAETCPKCKCYLNNADPDEVVMQTEEYKKKRRRDWLWILIGVPGMMLIIYGLYWLLKLLWP